MTFGETIRQARESHHLTQSALAGRVGATPGFITKLEKNDALPSDELLLLLAVVLELDSAMLLRLAERTRQERASQRIRTRGAAIRQVFGVGGQGDPATPETTSTEKPSTTAEQLFREIREDPELGRALKDLRTALADSDLKAAVLKTLEAFARQARPKKKGRRDS